MKRQPKPFYRPARDLWYVQLGGKQINLGRDKAKAFKAYHKLMLASDPREAAEASSITVAEIIDRFLDHQSKHRGERTVRWYKDFLRVFIGHFPKGLRAVDLKAYHVTDCVNANIERWASTNTRNAACRAIKGAVNWAFKQDIIEKQLLGGLPMPRKQPREVWYEPEEMQDILDATNDETFRDLLILARETGARPQEIKRCTAANFDRAKRVWRYKLKDSKGGVRQRRILLSDTAFEMTCRAVLKYPEGPIFRAANGKRWSGTMLRHRFRQVAKKLGWQPFMYAIRHTFARDALRNGVDAIYVAELMGHTDLQMISRVYGHVASDSKVMADRLKQALSGKPQGEKNDLRTTG